MAVMEPLGSYDSETRGASRLKVVRLVDLLGPISPELVLVDPQLAAHARALLPDLEAVLPPRSDEHVAPARVEPPPALRDLAIPWRLVGAGVTAVVSATIAVGAWTTLSGDDAGPSAKPSNEPAPTFFSTPPAEPDVSPDELAALEAEARRTPRSAVAREALGIAYLRLGRWKDAEKELRVLVELSPSDDFGHYALGRALANQGRQWEAARQFKLAESLVDSGAPSAEPLP